jgi:hypothetical protein
LLGPEEFVHVALGLSLDLLEQLGLLQLKLSG